MDHVPASVRQASRVPRRPPAPGKDRGPRTTGPAPPFAGLLLALSLLDGGAAAATPCEDLSCASPVQPPPTYWDAWRSTTDRVMAGRGAPAMYRDTANQMRAWWVLYAFDRETPWLAEEDADRARELALGGTLSGLETMVRETFERSETLGVVYRIGRTAGGADLEIRQRDGQTKVRYNAQPAGSVRAAQAELDDDAPLSGADRARSFRSGVGLQLVDVSDDEDSVDPKLMATSYLDLRRLGFDALRLQLSDTPPGVKARNQGNWSVHLRQGLVRDLDVFARVAGRESRGWLPSRATSGLSLRLPTESPWVLRSELSHGFPATLESGEQSPAEWRGMLTLRAQLRWQLPAWTDGWPLGADVDPDDRDLLPD